MTALKRIRQAIHEEQYRISSHANDEMNMEYSDQCEFCDGEMQQQVSLVRFRYRGQTIYVEDVPVWVCNRCGEEYFDAKVYKRLENIARQREQIQRSISFPLAEFDMVAA